jgi:Protein of unknown function (DUF3540)
MSTHPFVRSVPQATQQPTATVLAIQENGCLLKTPQGIIKARVAYGCMVQPQAEDTVLYADTDQGCFITQILLRTSAEKATVHYSEGIQITSDQQVSIQAQQGIKLETPAETSLTSNRLNIASLSTQFRSISAAFHMKEAEGHFGRIKWLADWAEQKADKIRQRFKHSDRVVSETDQQQAGSLIQRVEKTASLRAKHTIIKAKEDVQVDGKRIHMG